MKALLVLAFVGLLYVLVMHLRRRALDKDTR